MLLDVQSLFDAELKKITTDLDLQRFLLGHERKQVCLKNLSFQIMNAEVTLGARFGRKQLELLVSNVARMFADNAIRHRQQMNLSELEKLRQAKGPKTESDILSELKEMGCELKTTSDEAKDKAIPNANTLQV